MALLFAGLSYAPPLSLAAPCRYIRQGQVITVMGILVEEQGTHELIIQPLSKPRNISKFLPYKGFLPFFFPTWVSGLLISDQRDINA